MGNEGGLPARAYRSSAWQVYQEARRSGLYNQATDVHVGTQNGTSGMQSEEGLKAIHTEIFKQLVQHNFVSERKATGMMELCCIGTAYLPPATDVEAVANDEMEKDDESEGLGVGILNVWDALWKLGNEGCKINATWTVMKLLGFVLVNCGGILASFIQRPKRDSNEDYNLSTLIVYWCEMVLMCFYLFGALCNFALLLWFCSRIRMCTALPAQACDARGVPASVLAARSTMRAATRATVVLFQIELVQNLSLMSTFPMMVRACVVRLCAAWRQLKVGSDIANVKAEKARVEEREKREARRKESSTSTADKQGGFGAEFKDAEQEEDAFDAEFNVGSDATLPRSFVGGSMVKFALEVFAVVTALLPLLYLSVLALFIKLRSLRGIFGEGTTNWEWSDLASIAMLLLQLSFFSTFEVVKMETLMEFVFRFPKCSGLEAPESVVDAVHCQFLMYVLLEVASRPRMGFLQGMVALHNRHASKLATAFIQTRARYGPEHMDNSNSLKAASLTS